MLKVDRGDLKLEIDKCVCTLKRNPSLQIITQIPNPNTKQAASNEWSYYEDQVHVWFQEVRVESLVFRLL